MGRQHRRGARIQVRPEAIDFATKARLGRLEAFLVRVRPKGAFACRIRIRQRGSNFQSRRRNPKFARSPLAFARKRLKFLLVVLFPVKI